MDSVRLNISRMSFSSNRRDTLDPTLPLNHRASHARSCAMLIGQKWRVHRNAVIAQVLRQTGVDLNRVTEERELVSAMMVLEELRTHGLTHEQAND